MRLTLATFIIMLTIILAIIFIKYRPNPIYYISLEKYYAADAHCTAWAYLTNQSFAECLDTFLLRANSNIIYSIILTKYRYDTVLEKLNLQLLREKCVDMYSILTSLITLSNEGYIVVNALSYKYYNGTLCLNRPKICLSYCAYMLVIKVKPGIYYVFTDRALLSINVTVTSTSNVVCTYSRTLLMSLNMSAIVIKCSSETTNYKIEIIDERGINVTIS